MIANQKVTEFY